MARVPASREVKSFFRDFGARIQEYRRQRGLTQAELAEVLGCSQQQVASFEKGRRKIPVSSLPALAKAFGITVDELIGYRSDAKPPGRPRRVGRPSKLESQIERFSKLPRSDQRFVSRMIEAALQQAEG